MKLGGPFEGSCTGATSSASPADVPLSLQIAPNADTEHSGFDDLHSSLVAGRLTPSLWTLTFPDLLPHHQSDQSEDDVNRRDPVFLDYDGWGFLDLDFIESLNGQASASDEGHT